MKPHGELIHLIGSFSDKLEALPTVSQPTLGQIIREISKFNQYHKDSDSSPEMWQLWECALKNPALESSDFELLLPLVFTSQNTLSKYKNLGNEIITHPNLSDTVMYNYLTNFYLNFKEHYSTNQNTVSLIKSVITKVDKFPLSNQLLIEQVSKVLSKCSGDELLNLKSFYRRDSFLKRFYLLTPVSLQDVNNEVQKRKHKTPSSWKSYTSKEYTNFVKKTQSISQQIKINRKSFFKMFKNRILSPNDIVKESQEYLELLENLEKDLQSQKADIQNRIKGLLSQDKDLKPDPSESSD